ncbi:MULTISPECIES: flagellar biosynthesis protein FlhF [unclassified Candidatus Frackibacter]|uniref:flagellar biosynthesis protein FlhF n=1 Tax=unclassified Candidatus Frackibacter TaxID=2648818 RepID=UPI000882395C|nr:MULTISPECIES: flagellar biosynthesis protein FlhF [unclassified Candidatus Frackibacter]SDB99262.1 flagellar biosynthesis protein FlhF [Candidatus Frackibacter sp. WG11]SEM30917.1 flagellar biosynthesis protein FlhF [Candidatus Frackibacter sp. WG12]SFL35860.1 flagellar biosynthesis protein FlhF [Candidatus Frackibacter sp. WG13]
MEVKRYRGENMQEAMFKVKADLGADAIILHTRKFKKGGFLGFFGKKIVEVIATIDKQEENQKYEKLQQELNQMKQMMNNFLNELESKQLTASYNHLPESLQQITDKLLTCGVKEELATEILRSITDELEPQDFGDHSKTKEILATELEKRLAKVSPVELDSKTPKVVALIGPTGVGKTTTIAKLAANFNLIKNKNVALITADTYRVAAVEQLKTYSEIIGSSLEVVFTPSELNRSIDKFMDKDIVLIDTAGRSQKNQMQMSELNALIDSAKIDEKYLVLSATTKFNDIIDIILNFESIGIDKFIFTKLDETNNLGILLNVVEEFDKPLSYITNGQNVPEDIEVLDPKKIVDNFLKEQL